MIMSSFSFVEVSKSAEGGKNLLADMDRGSMSASGFGLGGPIPPIGHRHCS